MVSVDDDDDDITISCWLCDNCWGPAIIMTGRGYLYHHIIIIIAAAGKAKKEEKNDRRYNYM